MPLKSRASEARAARTPAAPAAQSPEVVGPGPSDPREEVAIADTPATRTRKGRAPSADVAARRANEKRLNEIMVEVRALKAERQKALDTATKTFDDKLKALQDEHNRILFS